MSHLKLKKVDSIITYNGKHTGIIKDKTGSIAYLKNGLTHRVDGPAIIFAKPKEPFGREIIEWYFEGTYYGRDDDFTVESWTCMIRSMVF